MKMQPGRTWEARPALRLRSRPAFGQRRTCGRALVVVRGRESRPHGEGGQSDGSGTKRTTPEAGCMNPTRMAEKPMFPTHPSNPSDGEPDAVKVARPVRRGGWRKPAGAVRPSAAPSLPNAGGFDEIRQGGLHNARHRNCTERHQQKKADLTTGEPDAVKAACPVRRGADGKVLR